MCLSPKSTCAIAAHSSPVARPTSSGLVVLARLPVKTKTVGWTAQGKGRGGGAGEGGRSLEEIVRLAQDAWVAHAQCMLAAPLLLQLPLLRLRLLRLLLLLLLLLTWDDFKHARCCAAAEHHVRCACLQCWQGCGHLEAQLLLRQLRQDGVLRLNLCVRRSMS